MTTTRCLAASCGLVTTLSAVVAHDGGRKTTTAISQCDSRTSIATSVVTPPTAAPTTTRFREQQISLQRLDPAVRADAKKLLDDDNGTSVNWELSTLAEIRQACIDGLGELSRHPKAQRFLKEVDISEIHNGPSPMRVYRPKKNTADSDPPPVIMFFHGGGFVICDPIANFDYACARLAASTGCVVVSVQYRQAPEHPFPAAPEDALRATQWVAGNAASLGVDGTRMATCGDSAGGNLATVVALMARDAGPKISLQLLLCPVVDYDFTAPSCVDSWVAPMPHLTTAHMVWYVRRYLTRPGDITDPRASPLRAERLEGVAPAVVINASHDPLSSAAEEYAERLRAAGALVRAKTHAGVMHDFYLRFHYEQTDAFWDDLSADVRRVLFGD